MDITMALLDTLIVASIFLPFIILNRIGNSSKRKLYKQFLKIASKNGLDITEKEFWSNSYIGIDNTKKMLLFMHSEKDAVETELVDLKDIEDCKVDTIVKKIRTKTVNQHILEKVNLQLCFRGKKTSIESLNFYDHNRIYSEDFEIKRAEKWKKLIEAHSLKKVVAQV